MEHIQIQKLKKKNLNENFKLRMPNSAFTSDKEVKNLGIVFDNEFRFRAHIAKVLHKCYMSLRQLLLLLFTTTVGNRKLELHPLYNPLKPHKTVQFASRSIVMNIVTGLVEDWLFI